MNDDIDNPLFQEQREKSGSKTFTKYQYQYHWALLHALEKFSQSYDHAVFVELHEDVISVDSIKNDPLEFDYFQIKCLTDTKLTIHKIAKEKKNGSTIFDKILSNYKNNSLRPNIKSLNLVSQNGFSLTLSNNKFELNKIKISDLIESEREILEECINSLDISEKPKNIFFVIPKLQEKNQDTQVIGEISTTINQLYPNKNFNPCSIYNVLINDLYSKGSNTVDYENWNDAIQNKSLSSNKIKQVISTFIEDPIHKNLKENFNEIINDLEYKSFKKISIKKFFNDLIIENYNPTSYDIEIENIIKPIVVQLIDEGVDDINSIINHVKSKIESHPKKELIETENELIARIILYILTGL
ncbi:dsDNA nuclease domain-containing protein [Acinetobacter soli]|uniref:dsDNA nuclease domain-containing protein n=1 Tax=Acinetobacter soli TaxID=487316 RepID=UPI003AA8DE66